MKIICELVKLNCFKFVLVVEEMKFILCIVGIVVSIVLVVIIIVFVVLFILFYYSWVRSNIFCLLNLGNFLLIIMIVIIL